MIRNKAGKVTKDDPDLEYTVKAALVNFMLDSLLQRVQHVSISSVKAYNIILGTCSLGTAYLMTDRKGRESQMKIFESQYSLQDYFPMVLISFAWFPQILVFSNRTMDW